MSDDDIKLLPCPFCGGAAHLEEHPPHKHFLVDMPDHPGSATIECGRCEAGMIAETAEAVAAAWNRRAAPSLQGDAEFEVWQDGVPVASASGPRAAALAEIEHYAAVYGQDGPVEVYEVTRTRIDADRAGRTHSPQGDAERLDFIAEHGIGVRRSDYAKRNLIVWTHDFPVTGAGLAENLRNAVDAARSTPAKGGEHD